MKVELELGGGGAGWILKKPGMLSRPKESANWMVVVVGLRSSTFKGLRFVCGLASR